MTWENENWWLFPRHQFFPPKARSHDRRELFRELFLLEFSHSALWPSQSFSIRSLIPSNFSFNTCKLIAGEVRKSPERVEVAFGASFAQASESIDFICSSPANWKPWRLRRRCKCIEFTEGSCLGIRCRMRAWRLRCRVVNVIGPNSIARARQRKWSTTIQRVERWSSDFSWDRRTRTSDRSFQGPSNRSRRHVITIVRRMISQCGTIAKPWLECIETESNSIIQMTHK